ncbi:MAG: hypothetical protein Q7W29_05245, partial [bacterium]|nr:hypothetical protein [bacterium]
MTWMDGTVRPRRHDGETERTAPDDGRGNSIRDMTLSSGPTAMTWTAAAPDPARLARTGWHVVRYEKWRAAVAASRPRGVRRSLINPNAKLLATFSRHDRVAVL